MSAGDLVSGEIKHTATPNGRHATVGVTAVWLDEVCGDYIVRLHDGKVWNDVLRQAGPIVNCTLYGVDLAARMPKAQSVDAFDDLAKQLMIARIALSNRRPITAEELRDIDAALAKAGSKQ